VTSVPRNLSNAPERIKHQRALAARVHTFIESGGAEEREVVAEVVEHFRLVWKKKARSNCRHLAHLGSQCGGIGFPLLVEWMGDVDIPIGSLGRSDIETCPEWDDPMRFAYRSIIESYLHAFIGRPAGRGSARARTPLMVTWAKGQTTATLETYFQGQGVSGQEEALRAWNAGRDLPVRLQSAARVRHGLREPWRVIWRDVLAGTVEDLDAWPESMRNLGDAAIRPVVDEMHRLVEYVGMARPMNNLAGALEGDADGWHVLIEALWWDAFQPPTSASVDGLSPGRLARHLWSRLGRTEHMTAADEKSAIGLATLVDRITGVIAPDWFQEWIESPRNATRQLDVMLVAGDRVGAIGVQDRG
jgi:hypothetical protein